MVIGFILDINFSLDGRRKLDVAVVPMLKIQ